jgi:hypothetical protein
MLKLGFGRKFAVISCARDSSMPICPARRVGFAASNLSRTSCHVSAFWAKPLPVETAVSNTPRQNRLTTRCMDPPCLVPTTIGKHLQARSLGVGCKSPKLNSRITRTKNPAGVEPEADVSPVERKTAINGTRFVALL